MSTSLDLDNGATIQTFVPGTKLFGRYVLQRLLGAGRKGDVWLAKDENISHEVALKLLRNYPHFNALQSQSGRLMDLSHHAVVSCIDTAGDAQLGAFVMEYFESRPLSTLLAERDFRPYEVTEIHRWVRDLFSALAYANDKHGILHQDIRLANLLVNADGIMKISEFGLAPALNSALTDDDFQHLPAISPQVLAGEAATHQDDLYAAAAAVYELLTGRPVFSMGNIPLQIKNKTPLSIAARRSELQIKGDAVPKAWEDWIARCLEKDPAKRPASAQEVLDLLESGATSRGTTRSTALSHVGDAMGTVVGNLREKDFSWLGGLIKAAVVLALLGAAVWHFWVKPQDEELAERRQVVAEIEARDAASQSQIEEFKKSGNKVSTLSAAQEVAKKAADRWQQFVDDYSEDDIAFTKADDTMLREARRHQRAWEEDAESLGKQITLIKEDEKNSLAKVDAAFTELRNKDALLDGKDTAAQMVAALDRRDDWARMLKAYGGESAPQNSNYQTVLSQAEAAKARWQALVDQQKKQADDWIALWEKKIEGIRAHLVLPDEPKQAKLALVQGGLTELHKEQVPLSAAVKVGEFTTALQKIQEEVQKIPDPVPVMTEPFPTTLAGLFKNTPLADKPEALQKQALIMLQTQLSKDGIYKGKADGAPGPALEQSLKDWQTKKQLPVTGLLDAGTWAVTEIGMMAPDALEKTLAEQKAAMAKANESSGSSGRSSGSKSKLSPRGINYTNREPERGYYDHLLLGKVRILKDTSGGKLKPEAAKDPEKVRNWRYHNNTWLDYCAWKERQ